MRVGELMNPEVVTVRHDDKLGTALQTLLWAGARALPVLEGDRVVGLLTERGLLQHRMRIGDWTALDRPVTEAMVTPVDVAEVDDDLEEAARLLAESDLECLPVAQGGRLVGLLVPADVLAHHGRQAFGELRGNAPRVGEVMSREPVSVRPTDYLLDAAQRMSLAGVRHLPVVDQGLKVVGILSDRDVRRTFSSETGAGMDASNPGPRVGDVMTREPLTLPPDAPLQTAVSYFIDWRIGAIPVVDPDERLLGIVSYIDALRSLRGGPRHGAN